jgi:hypothetical protein
MIGVEGVDGIVDDGEIDGLPAGGQGGIYKSEKKQQENGGRQSPSHKLASFGYGSRTHYSTHNRTKQEKTVDNPSLLWYSTLAASCGLLSGVL